MRRSVLLCMDQKHSHSALKISTGYRRCSITNSCAVSLVFSGATAPAMLRLGGYQFDDGGRNTQSPSLTLVLRMRPDRMAHRALFVTHGLG